MKTQGRRRSSNVVDRRAENYHGKSPALESTANRISRERGRETFRRAEEAARAEASASSRNRSSLEDAFRDLQRKGKKK